MPLVGFEPTISAFEQVKTVHALDRVDTVIGNAPSCKHYFHVINPSITNEFVITESR
jgi:hypothetical protein